MFKIGEFSQLVRVSPRMLRHYEKCGLLQPAKIDMVTGYRSYSAAQIPLLTKIVTLRDVGFSIDEISEILPHFDDVLYMGKILRAKAAEVKLTIEAEQEKLNRLLLMSDTARKEQNIMLYDVELKKVDAVKVLTLRGIIPKYNQEGLLWEKLGAFIEENQIECLGGGYSTYFDEEYQEENPDVEIAIPVAKMAESKGDFIYKEYPAIDLGATLRFSGAFDGGYDEATQKLAYWMEENGYNFAGHLRGHMIVEPDMEPDSEKWLTELQVAVSKTQ